MPGGRPKAHEVGHQDMSFYHSTALKRAGFRHSGPRLPDVPAAESAKGFSATCKKAPCSRVTPNVTMPFLSVVRGQSCMATSRVSEELRTTDL